MAAGAAAVVSTLAFSMPSRAGFTPEQLAGFEVTHLRGVVNAVLPKQKVIEVIDPEGHKEIVTVGIDMAPLRLRKGDRVDVSLLDGLVVDLERSKATTLSFDREDIYMPMDMGPLKKGMRVALASGTARVLKVSATDRSLSLMGPLGGIHNLDVVMPSGSDLFPALKAGDLVDFRLIQPVAVDIDRVSTPAETSGASQKQPLLSAVADRRTSLKAELLEAFELSQVTGTLLQFKPDQQVMELKSPYGHTLLITMGGGLKTAGVSNGDEVIIDILDGLVVDLSKSSASSLSFTRDDVILSEDFGEVRKGARVAMGTGTAEVVKVSEKDHELSLRGPFGGIHNLDVRPGLNGDPLAQLKVGDFVRFRSIQPIAIGIRPAG
ncbi:putative conserved secreted protein [Synechococcus sp. PROS-U-1]|nr:putative conserved secreted protein [Synechococcus sp. PROS-U-1]